MTPEEIDKLERIVKAATPAPWRDEREPFPVRNPWFERHDGAPIESRGTPFGLGVAVGVTAEPRDAAAIAALHNAAPALIAAAREVERLRAFVPRWRREDEYTLHLTLGPVALGGVMGPHPATGAWGSMVMDEETVSQHPDLPTAARAVCARLGIPYVPVDVDDG